MKKYILIIIIIIELVTFKIPPYLELNDLAIIEEIIVEKQQNNYKLTLKEKIPTKGDQGINYKYKYYTKTAKTIKKAYNYLQKSTKKRLYLNKAKSLVTNMTTSKKIIESLDINPKTITNTNKFTYKEKKDN